MTTKWIENKEDIITYNELDQYMHLSPIAKISHVEENGKFFRASFSYNTGSIQSELYKYATDAKKELDNLIRNFVNRNL